MVEHSWERVKENGSCKLFVVKSIVFVRPVVAYLKNWERFACRKPSSNLKEKLQYSD